MRARMLKLIRCTEEQLIQGIFLPCNAEVERIVAYVKDESLYDIIYSTPVDVDPSELSPGTPILWEAGTSDT